jgi:hypothetical protein
MSTYWENWGIGTALDDHLGAFLQVGGKSIQRQLKELYGGRDSTGHLTGVYCDPRDWTGWDPTGTNDISTYLQAAIAQAITDHVPVGIPPGVYATSPVDFGVNVNDGVQIVGVGGYPGNSYVSNSALGNHGSLVIFNPTAVDKPCFYNSHAVRGAHFANIGVLGPNNTWSYTQAPNDFKQNYNPGGVYRDAQWSPHCGFAIDSFMGATPADGGYPGMTSIYGAVGGSSGITFDNVNVQGFVVGMTVGLTGSQADTIFWNNCMIKQCDTAFAIGGGQSKEALMLFGLILGCRQAFDGANYGAKQGFPIITLGVCCQYLLRKYNYQDTFGPLMSQMDYHENVRSLGNYGTAFASVRGHCTIQGTQFTQDLGTSLPPPMILDTYGIASIRDMNFWGGSNTGPLAYNFCSDILSPIKFDTCQFAGQPAGVPGVVGMTATGSNVEFDNCLMNSGTPLPWSDSSMIDVGSIGSNKRWVGSVRANRYANGTSIVEYISSSASGVVSLAATGTAINSRSVTFTGTLAIGAIQGTLSTTWTDPTGWYMTTFPNTDVRPVNYVNGSTTAKWGYWGTSSAMTAPTATAVGVSLTFTATDPTVWFVGDILFWKVLKLYSGSSQRNVPAWVVTSVVGSAITAQPICDATYYDTVANNGAGTTINVFQPQWAPTANLTCTTNGTTALTAVLPINLIPTTSHDWVTGTGFAANTRIVSNDGAGNIVLNKAVTGSGTLIPMHFGQFQTPTMTATWT